MDLKTGTAKNVTLWGTVKQILHSLNALCCNTRAAIKPSEVMYLKFGGTAAATGMTNFYAIQAITDCTFSVLTIGNLAPGSDATIASATLTAGHMWYLDITAITLGAGECLIYKV